MWSVALGDWGELTVFSSVETVSQAPGAWSEWSDPARRVVELRAGDTVAYYVATWPTGRMPQHSAPASAIELEGLALCRPVVHRCAACGGAVPGLHLDTGVPFFKPFDHAHAWLNDCPVCGVDRFTARLTGLLV